MLSFTEHSVSCSLKWLNWTVSFQHLFRLRFRRSLRLIILLSHCFFWVCYSAVSNWRNQVRYMLTFGRFKVYGHLKLMDIKSLKLSSNSKILHWLKIQKAIWWTFSLVNPLWDMNKQKSSGKSFFIWKKNANNASKWCKLTNGCWCSWIHPHV